MSFSIAFTGHRKISSDLDENETEKIMEDALKRGADTFYCGMAYGFDLLCCQILSRLREKYTFRLIGCVPCKGQEKTFSPENRRLYRRMCLSCDELVVLSENYYNGCMQARDRYMVDRADEIIAYLNDNKGGTAYTVRYAVEKSKKIHYVC